MGLSGLEISNLKCFTELRLGLAPLTLLTGFNSAGKSTALQAITLLSQGLCNDHESAFLPLNGTFVRLGSSGDVLSNRADSRLIQITVSSHADKVTWLLDTVGPRARALRVSKVTEITAQKTRDWKNQLWLAKGRSGTNEIVDALKSIIWISAVRLGTVDVFPSPDDAGLANAAVGNEGQYAAWWYAEKADDEVDEARRHPNETALTLRRQLDAYLNDLFPGAHANADDIPGTSLVRLGLRNEITSDWLRPINVGYGLTYSFPILTALLLARRDQIVMVDSPEAHLHPSAQSRMGHTLARFANSGVQIFAETHSDHILNGVRLAVRDGLISPEGVAVHFFSGVDQPAHGVITPRLDKAGGLDAWPEGFFDQMESDLTTLTGWRDAQ